MSKTDIGKLIEIAMIEKNLTQKMLADKLDIKQPMISQWINGKSNPTTRTLQKISKLLNKPLDYFVKNEDEDKNLSDKTDKKDIEILKLKNENLELSKKVLTLENEILKLKMEIK